MTTENQIDQMEARIREARDPRYPPLPAIRIDQPITSRRQPRG